jgi:hypothetical protein
MFDDPLAGELAILNVLAPGETARGLDHFGDAQVCNGLSIGISDPVRNGDGIVVTTTLCITSVSPNGFGVP